MAEMRVAFIQEGNTMQHGVMILSAILKEHNFLTDVFSLHFEKDRIENVLEFKPDLLACSVTTVGFRRMMALINRMKQRSPKILTILGGPHPTFYPEIIFQEKNLDFVCRGEGEYALLELVSSLSNGKSKTDIENIWFKKGKKVIKNEVRELVDLDSLPYPDIDIYAKRYSFLLKGDIKFNVGRGCPFDCSFCFNRGMKELYRGKGIWTRLKDKHRLIQEIKQVKKKHSIKWVSFNDDTFNVNKVWLKEFMELYKKEINIPFLCQLRLDLADEKQIEMLKRAGVNRVTVGIEHGDESFRKRMLNKHISNEQILNFAKWINKRKIRLHTTNIMGFPEETVEMAFSTVELNAKIKPEVASCNILSPYPGTDIYEYAKKHNYLAASFQFSDLMGHKTWGSFRPFVKSYIKNKDISRILSLRCFFGLMVIFPWLKPIVRLLIRIHYNRFYEFIGKLTGGEFKIYWRFATDWEERKDLLGRLFNVF